MVVEGQSIKVSASMQKPQMVASLSNIPRTGGSVVVALASCIQPESLAINPQPLPSTLTLDL
jgi:hypothetical protein